MTVYSETFKKKRVARMLMPNPRSMTMLARETGVTEPTLYRWRNEATLKAMSTDHPEEKPTPTKPPHAWSPEDKLAVVLEATAVPEAEPGAFLRRKALHEAQFAEWRKQVEAITKCAAVRSRRARSLGCRTGEDVDNHGSDPPRCP